MLINCFNCNTISRINNYSNEITDPVFKPPFKVDGFENEIVLPDSLSMYKNGRIDLLVIVNDSIQVDGYNIIYLNLLEDESDSLVYYNYSTKIIPKDKYPNEIRKFIPFIDEIVQKIKIIKVDSVAHGTKFGLRLPMKVK